MTAFFASIPAMIILTGALVGIAATLPGTFLVLRGSSMLADAISHSIVLGIVLVWLATGVVTGPILILGAAVAGLVTVVASEAIARTRLVQGDAAIGLVFPALFALGVLLINLNARNVHIDVHSVLLGEIGFVWLDVIPVAGVEVPRAVVWLSVMTALNAAFVMAFWKEVKVATFDPGLAAALGLRPRLMINLLLALTSATAVAAFEAVGAVLFVAFVIVPAATAILLSDRLGTVMILAVGGAVLSAVLGYPAAVAANVSIGGMMALMAGGLFALAFVFSPRHGIFTALRARAAARSDADCRTLAAHLFTHEGGDAEEAENSAPGLAAHLHWAAPRITAVLLASLDRGFITRDGDRLTLTPKGRAVAEDIFTPLRR